MEFSMSFRMSFRGLPSALWIASPLPLWSRTAGVGQGEDEDPCPLMTGADFRRADEYDLTSERHCGQVSSHARRACNLAFRPDKHAGDVFDPDEPRARFIDDAPHVGPEVALVVCTLALSGGAVGLARDAANDAIHKAAPRSASEG